MQALPPMLRLTAQRSSCSRDEAKTHMQTSVVERDRIVVIGHDKHGAAGRADHQRRRSGNSPSATTRMKPQPAPCMPPLLHPL
jgi:hypothetical protein